MTALPLATVALIPARAHSKGVPGKNWRVLGGRTLVQRAIDCATGAGPFADVLLSTDHPSAPGLCTAQGLSLVRRSASTSSDEATAADVVRECLPHIQRTTEGSDAWIVYLQPTSVFRTSDDVRGALELLTRVDARGVVSVVENAVSPFKSLLLRDGVVDPVFTDASLGSNRQSLPATYRPNGAIYIFRVSDFLAAEAIPIAGAHAFVMSTADSIDIDSEDDWAMAERRIADGT